jgi:hypothetical protein
LDVPDPQQLVVLASGDRTRFSFATWEQIRDRRWLFEQAYAWMYKPVNLAPTGETDIVLAAFASASTFETLRVGPLIGRVFGAADDIRTGGPDGHVAVLTHRFWLRRFAADPAIVGRSLTIEGVPFTIVGVLSPTLPGLEVGSNVDLVVPLSSDAPVDRQFNVLESRARQNLRVVLRADRRRPIADVVAALRDEQPAIRSATIPQRGPREQRSMRFSVSRSRSSPRHTEAVRDDTSPCRRRSLLAWRRWSCWPPAATWPRCCWLTGPNDRVSCAFVLPSVLRRGTASDSVSLTVRCWPPLASRSACGWPVPATPG